MGQLYIWVTSLGDFFSFCHLSEKKHLYTFFVTFALQEIKMLIVVTEAQSYKIGGNYVNSLKISNVFLVLYGIIQFKDISSFRMKLSLTVSNIEEKTE